MPFELLQRCQEAHAGGSIHTTRTGRAVAVFVTDSVACAVHDQELNHAIWTSCITGLGCVIGGCVMLPSLARDEMRDTAASTLRNIGVAISG